MEKLFSTRRILIMITLFVCLCSVYMMFYNANWAEFGDSPYLLNTTASLVRYQDTQFDLMAYNWPQRPDNVFFSNRLYPLFDYGEDMLSVTLATPLYWLAFNIDGIGLVQTVWLFNIITVALCGVVMYLYTIALGYSERTALLSALILGLTTALVPYAKTFLQEPSALLVTLSLALVLERWRASHYRNWKLLPLIPLLGFALIHSKVSAPSAILGLIIIALPSIKLSVRHHRLWHKFETVFFLLFFSFIIAVSFIDLRPLFEPFTPLVSDFDSPYIMIAMRTYFFSLTASMWGSSPLALLAIPGFIMLYRTGNTRYLWACLLIIWGYSFGYAVFRDLSWYGSVTWAPRFLIPTIPYWLLMGLPVIDHVVHTPRSRLVTILVASLFAYGIWIQFNGISYHWADYDKLLPINVSDITSGNAAYSPAWMPWVLLPQQWNSKPFDIVWVRMNLLGIPALFGGLALTALGRLIWQLRNRIERHGLLFTASLPISLLGLIIFALISIYPDPLYHAYNHDLEDMLPLIEQETEPPDMVFITGSEHIEFMFNYGTIRNARLVGLPFQPGEQYSPEVPTQIEADSLAPELFNPTTIPLLQASAEQRERLWLLTEFSAFHWWARRPIEHYMVSEFYPVREITTSASVRLIEFATSTALNINNSAETYTTNFVFGESIQLSEVTLPLGTSYSAGDLMPFELIWQTDTAIDQNYTVATFLSDNARQQLPIQGWDSQPMLGFMPTTEWQTDERVQDNRAIRLPENLQAGDYQLWVRLYRGLDDGTLEILSISGETVADINGDMAIIPITITIE